ncbi:hypothetical protein ARMGADRAFT_1027710 [Armillaria gallica]|uniref:Uncharacterized protein n=1 Tax=Armillaria gallica TaxID=47427 RepID=A0A2H3EAQ0_ARMGA|nr:hypothetical protein ARMGADRAFT_1027710 [Armillaria gallica]
MPTKVCLLLFVLCLTHPAAVAYDAFARITHFARLYTPWSHPFDSLPWIDILDSPPDESMANLGDLSQLGPVRRHRKARSSPLSRPRRLPSSSPSPSPPPPASLPPALLERCSTPPPPTTRPSYVIFHDLMPQL